MAYTATVIPVMIASPGDVAEERQVIREMIHEWNDINSARSKSNVDTNWMGNSYITRIRS